MGRGTRRAALGIDSGSKPLRPAERDGRRRAQLGQAPHAAHRPERPDAVRGTLVDPAHRRPGRLREVLHELRVDREDFLGSASVSCAPSHRRICSRCFPSLLVTVSLCCSRWSCSRERGTDSVVCPHCPTGSSSILFVLVTFVMTAAAAGVARVRLFHRSRRIDSTSSEAHLGDRALHRGVDTALAAGRVGRGRRSARSRGNRRTKLPAPCCSSGCRIVVARGPSLRFR